MTTLTRQMRRRIGREEEKNPTYIPMKDGGRRFRRHYHDHQNDVVNQRSRTKGRNIYYQYFYDVISTNGKSIVTFSVMVPLRSNTTAPKHIWDKIEDALIKLNKKKIKTPVSFDHFKLFNTVRHIRPSQNYIKVQKIIMERTLNRNK